MERLEVLEGPAGVLFGRGSTGGVVNYVSKAPTLSPLTVIGITLGTDGTKRATEIAIDQHRHIEAKGRDAIGNLPDLLLAVPPRVRRVGLQRVDRTVNDFQPIAFPSRRGLGSTVGFAHGLAPCALLIDGLHTSDNPSASGGLVTRPGHKI
jgi:hypothetical protein